MKINSNTQKAEGMIWSYQRATEGDIYEAYTSPSYSKVKAFNDIRREMVECGGYGLRVTGHNSSFFSCAYLKDEDNKTVLVYHTYANKYEMDF